MGDLSALRQWFLEEMRTRGVRFLLVGLLNSAFGFAIYSLGIYMGLGYLASSAMAMVLGVLFNFRTIGTLVFRDHDGAPFWRFVLCYVLVLGFTVLLLEASGWLGVNPYLAGLLVSIPAAVISYVLQRQFVFRGIRRG